MKYFLTKSKIENKILLQTGESHFLKIIKGQNYKDVENKIKTYLSEKDIKYYYTIIIPIEYLDSV